MNNDVFNTSFNEYFKFFLTLYSPIIESETPNSSKLSQIKQANSLTDSIILGKLETYRLYRGRMGINKEMKKSSVSANPQGFNLFLIKKVSKEWRFFYIANVSVTINRPPNDTLKLVPQLHFTLGLEGIDAS